MAEYHPSSFEQNADAMDAEADAFENAHADTIIWVVGIQDGTFRVYMLKPSRFGYDGLPSREKFLDLVLTRKHGRGTIKAIQRILRGLEDDYDSIDRVFGTLYSNYSFVFSPSY